MPMYRRWRMARKTIIRRRMERKWKTIKHLMKGKLENCKLKKYKDKKVQIY